MTKVLVVEDDSAIQELLAFALAQSGYGVEQARSAEIALASIKRELPDVVVLDWMLPGMTGLAMARRLRSDHRTRALPIIMVTARGDEPDKLAGLEQGADDYLTKPFSPQELVLRVGAILRRLAAAGTAASDALTIGPIEIDRSAHRVRIDGLEIELTATEFKLLLTLAERRGRVQGRAHLLETVWDAAPDIQTRTVDMHIQRLRTKLGVASDLIETVRGFGYRLRSPSARAS